MLDLIVLHGEFSIFTVRGNFWYQIYRNRRKKVLCSRLSLITLTNRDKGCVMCKSGVRRMGKCEKFTLQ